MTRGLPAVLIGLSLLAGCARLAGNPAPSTPTQVGSRATQAALASQIERSPKSGGALFAPLQKARHALKAAKAQPRVHDYDGQALQRAERALARAESGWQPLADAHHRPAAELADVASAAHRAQRLAEIAEYTAKREIGLAQLGKLDANIQPRQKAAAGGKDTGQNLVGQKAIPDRFGAVAFEPGTARLTQASRRPVRHLAQWLADHPSLGVAIYGHTDSSAPSADRLQAFVDANPALAKRKLTHAKKVRVFNTALSSARARSVGKALVDDGVAKRRIGARGFGSQRPVAGNDTAQGRRANRRVVAVIVRRPDSAAAGQTPDRGG